MADKRATMAEVAERFATGSPFTTRNTLRSVNGAVTGPTGLPPALNRLYVHWLKSGSYTVTMTVVGGRDGATVIGWVGNRTDPRTGRTERQIVIPSYETTDKTLNGHRTALSGKV